MSAEDTLKELSSKLAVYEGQRSQVSLLLGSDPTNAQFKTLLGDLSTLINMTQILYESAKAKQNGRCAEVCAENRTIDDTEIRYDEDITRADAIPESSDTSWGTSELQNIAHESAQTNIEASAPMCANIPIVPCSEASGEGALGIGSIVLVSGGERLYAGYITAVIMNPNLPGGSGVRIKYYEYPNEVELPWSAIARMPTGPVNVGNRLSLVNDWQGQCKYGPDQRYYSVRILALTPYGAQVLYPEFGTSEEVPLAYLRPNKHGSGQRFAVSDTKPALVNVPLEIPEKYQLKDTDTAEERARKLKKMKSIKAKNKEITKDTELAAVQHSWKKFVSQSSKRNLQGMVKTSMFNTDRDSVQESLTNFESKKRHKFQ